MSSTRPRAILWPVPRPNTSCGYTARQALAVTPPAPTPVTVIDGYSVALWDMRRGVRNEDSSRGRWYGHDYRNRIVVR